MGICKFASHTVEWTCRQSESQCRLLAVCRADSYTLNNVAMYLCIHRRRSSEIAFCGKNKFTGTVFDLSFHFRTTKMSRRY